MPDTTDLRVQLLTRTEFVQPDVPWSPDGSAAGGPAAAEFGGRACYQSWEKPNPRTATNEGYLANILTIGHESVLEHGTAGFYVTGVSRSLTHELVRHRHLSPSQLSQRYVPEGDADMVVPDVIAADPDLSRRFDDAAAAAVHAYNDLLDGLTARYGAGDTVSKKLARQAARAVLPNATETRIVLTGNYRAWRHFVALRATPHADREIRALAVAVLRELQRPDVAAPVFADFTIAPYRDHPAAPPTEIATSPLVDH